MAHYAIAEAPPDEHAPVIPFDLFTSRVFDWKQDQHVGIIGPTDQGKTNLAYHLLPQRAYVGYLGIKRDDPTLENFARHGGYTRVLDYPPKSGRVVKRPVEWADMPRRLIWPDASDRRAARAVQQRVFHAALDDIWARKNICVVWDDFWYHVRILGLELDAKQNLLNARSSGSAQMVISQRAGGNRLVELLDQPTHLFFAREDDPRNLALLGPANSLIRRYVQTLDQYQFLYRNTRTQHMYRITAPLIDQR